MPKLTEVLRVAKAVNARCGINLVPMFFLKPVFIYLACDGCPTNHILLNQNGQWYKGILAITITVYMEETMLKVFALNHSELLPIRADITQ